MLLGYSTNDKKRLTTVGRFLWLTFSGGLKCHRLKARYLIESVNKRNY